jgi:PilZ domain
LQSKDVHRRWPRDSLDVPIRVIVHNASKTRVFVGRGNELREGGLSLTAGVELNPGDEAEVEFTPPYSGLPIRIRGIVRNRKGYRYGVEFLAGSDREAEQVDHLRTMLSVLSSA